MIYALIFAGGTGKRMGNNIPKQFLEVDNKPIIIHTVEKFSTHHDVDGIVVVCKEDYILYCEKIIKKFRLGKVLSVIPGGKTGQDSIFNGLNFLNNISNKADDNIVLIHDGVRPIVDNNLISKSIACTKKHGNSIAVSKAIETIIKIDVNGKMVEAIDRDFCRYAKAPQSFFLNQIYEMHIRARREGKRNIIDSATMMNMYGEQLYTVECEPENIKITTPNDFYTFKALYQNSTKG